MLEIMSIVAVVAMVVLLSTIKRLRAVSHDMWVKMVNMEFEIDHQRKAWEEHRSVEHFKGILDSLYVDTNTILQNLEP